MLRDLAGCGKNFLHVRPEHQGARSSPLSIAHTTVANCSGCQYVPCLSDPLHTAPSQMDKKICAARPSTWRLVDQNRRGSGQHVVACMCMSIQGPAGPFCGIPP